MYYNCGSKLKAVKWPTFYRVDFICSLLLVIAPILDIYAFFTVSISFGEIAIIVATLLSLFQGDVRRWHIGRKYLFLLFYFLLISVLQIQEYTLIKQWISFTYFVIAIGLIETNHNSVRWLFRLYCNVATAEAILIILQRIVYTLFHINIPGLIPGMLTTPEDTTQEYIKTISGIRCTGNLTEPAMAARYLAFPLLFSIFDVIRTKKIVNVNMIIYVLALVCTFSGNAFIVLSIALAYYILQQITIKRKNKYVKYAGVIILMLTIFLVMAKMVNLEYLWSRRIEFTGKGVTGKSAYIRVTRGYEAFAACSIIQKVFGVGIGNYTYLAGHELYKNMTLVTETLMDYMNGIQFYLIQGGIIGLAFFLSQFISIFRENTKESRWLCIVMLAMMSFSSIAISPIYLIYYLCIFKYSFWRKAEYDMASIKDKRIKKN